MMFYFFLVFILFLSVFLWGLYDIIIRSFDLDRSFGILMVYLMGNNYI